MRALFVLLLGACSFQHGVAPDDGRVASGDDASDAPVDAPPDAFDPRCFGRAPFTICLQSVPTDPFTVPTDIRTNTTGTANCTSIGGSIAMLGGVEVCVLAGTDVTAGGTLVGVSGTRPLVIVATGTITINTTNFDVTSGHSGDGPNANPPDCAPTAAQNGTGGNGGGGGGAGGSFGAKGGDGGAGSSGGLAAGVAKAAPTTFDKLRGGCAGGQGDGPNGTAAGGSGGGALYLVARTAIVINGKINASGAGGIGGLGARGGGGGGGSGGMVVLHAPTLSIGAAGRVFANGGGGGGGAGNSGNDGGDGADGLVPETAALGGVAGDTQGTAGGNGGFKSTGAVTPANAAQGGGGGGGAVGVIRILSGQSVAPINVSPTPILN